MRNKNFKGVWPSALIIASIIALAIPLLSTSPAHAALTSHAPIYINGNSQFTSSNGVDSGSGSENDPYLINSWLIDASSANGIYIENTTVYFIVANCTVQNGGPAYYGINFDNVINGIAENNTIENCIYGINLRGSRNNLLQNNTVENNYPILDNDNVILPTIGIVLDLNSENNTLSGNNLTNSKCGISVLGPNNVISGNTVDGNFGDGIELVGPGLYYNNIPASGAENEIVYGNTIENNGGTGGYGIDVSQSDNNIIYSNTFENNGPLEGGTAFGGGGLTLDGLPRNNLVYHNNFINNAPLQAGDVSVHLNFWDNGYPSGGNYWSDYTGVDIYHGPNQNIPGSDGIGDNAYYINSATSDRFPLMIPWPHRSVSVSISPTSQNGATGATLTYIVTITNTGNVSDSYCSLLLNDNAGWSPSVSTSSLRVCMPLPPGSSENATIIVIIPSSAVVGAIDNMTVTAAGTGDSATCTATATKTPTPSGGISPIVYVGIAVVIVVIIAAVLILKVV